ncbi:hypothetical protein C8J56DRAFT_23893 [Mycena floridula]|nr:hypothetical protein C8J56DRAFT_23893 [Mycena floridula]
MPSIPATARAAVLSTFKEDLVVKTDYAVKQSSELAPGECLIKMEYAGCCHSDIHIKNNDWAAQAAIPIVLGHEGVGNVVAIGEHTSASHVKVGDRVGCKWLAKTCLSSACEFCRKGYESCCPSNLSHGFKVDGMFQDYAVSYIDYVTPIPDGLDSLSATPILCAGLTIYKALVNSKATVGQWVALSGAGGGLGHLGIQYAVAMGLRVIAIDTGEEKEKLCLKLGAEKWVDFMKSKDLIQDVKLAAGGLGPHAAVIATGNEAPFNQALMYLRPAGTLVAVGMPPVGACINVPINLLIAKSLNIVGSAIGNRQDIAQALEIAAQGKVKVHVHEVRELEAINEVLTAMENGKIAGRVVIKF